MFRHMKFVVSLPLNTAQGTAVQHPWAEGLREHGPRFPCCGILQCWWSSYEMSDDKTGSLVHTLIHSGISKVFYLPWHRTLSTRHPLALRRIRLRGCWVSAVKVTFWKFLGSPPGGSNPGPPAQQASYPYHLTTQLPRPLSYRDVLTSHMLWSSINMPRAGARLFCLWLNCSFYAPIA